MANGDTFFVGVAQPPKNRATSVTLLVHDGNPFGTQHTAFWVQRFGTPLCSATIRGDNFSTGPSTGVLPVGVLGMAGAAAAGVGVLGTAVGKPGQWDGQTGVMGVANSVGVHGTALVDQVQEGDVLLTSAGVVGDCNDGIGVRGSATKGFGILGESLERAGVTGTSVAGVGMDARSEQSHGVQATAQSGDGVLASSRAAIGVEGITEQGPAGVRGLSNNSDGVLGESALAAGVRGRSKDGAGVVGESVQGDGVMGFSPATAVLGWSTGTSDSSVGVIGFSSAGEGVYGESETGTGVFGRSSRGLAAHFKGNVIVEGDFSVVGGSKSAAVRHPDGTNRLLFALESPESYFEDFGEVTLAEESVVVPLDKDFAALVKTNKYQVFLTSYGPEALYVRKRGPEGFEVARVNPASGKPRKVQVGYRIVARRGDLKPARLPETEPAPQVTEVSKPDLVSGKVTLTGAEAVTPSLKIDPLPVKLKLPSPDLKALVEAKPTEE